jgi:UDP-N-acetylmuramate--alanine ligase
MHIFFSGIGGGGVGPLALIAKQAGYDVSGSDKQASAYTEQLQKQGIDLYIGQTEEKIAALHARQPIDWFVYSSALPRENPQHPELVFAKAHHIKLSKRDELLNTIITNQKLKLVGIAGTHGKSTTTAMVAWLFYALGIPIGHSVGAKIPFAPMGQLQPHSEYFVYECDEFDNNFLAFHPHLALITGVSWDHHEVFPTRESYKNAYRTFIHQSNECIIWHLDFEHLGLSPKPQLTVIDEQDPGITAITLAGEYNRQNAWQAILAVHTLTGTPMAELVAHANRFPGLKQRMEQLAPNLYTNYAHTPEKIKGGLLTALELAKPHKQEVVVIYEPLTNRRQHYIKDDYKDTFAAAKKVYWTPTYLAREDPNLPLLTPKELIAHLSNPHVAEPAIMDETLLAAIKKHMADGDIVVAMGASGAGSLDEWLREHFATASSPRPLP